MIEDNFDISYAARNISYDAMWNLTPLERDIIVDRLIEKLDSKKNKGARPNRGEETIHDPNS